MLAFSVRRRTRKWTQAAVVEESNTGRK